MLNRQTLFGSRDAVRDADRNTSGVQTRPNPAHAPAPAAEAVRAPDRPGNATDRGSDIPPIPRGLPATQASVSTVPPAAGVGTTTSATTSAGAAPGARSPGAGPAAAGAVAEVTASSNDRTSEASPASPEARMVVGPNIKMRGVEINDCDTLIVEGTVEATMDARQIEIAGTGTYSGKASVDRAEIHGLFTGELTVRERLIVHATGKVGGTLRYGRLVIEEGGEISGDVKPLGDESRGVAAVAGRGTGMGEKAGAGAADTPVRHH